MEQKIKEKIQKQRKQKDKFFKSGMQSPIPYEKRSNFSGLSYYDYSLKLRYKLNLNKHDKKEKIEVEDSKGGKQEFIRFGEFQFDINGNEQKLQAYKSKPAEQRLWVPFKDKTNGNETYGAGRYIDLDSNDKEGNKWVLDFNQSYNPFCAYNEKYVCPFIPPENWLKIEVKAGEKKYKK